MFDVEQIERKLGYHFEDKSLLKLAFTHSSYAHEHGTSSNEKLEFLGDSILNFCIAEHLFRKGAVSEGELSVRRSQIVSKEPTAEAIRRLDLVQHLICGVGESKKEKSVSVMSDLFEAVCAAIYLDSDIYTAERFILKQLRFVLEELADSTGKTVFRLPERQVDNNNFPDDYDDGTRRRGRRPAAAKGPQKAAGESRERKAGKEKPLKPEKDKGKKEKKPREEAPIRREKPDARQEKLAKKAEKKNKKVAAAVQTPAASEPVLKTDYKSLLQMHTQKNHAGEIEYRMTGQSGTPHQPHFKVAVLVAGAVQGEGEGSRKKDAEQAAARDACRNIGVPEVRF